MKEISRQFRWLFLSHQVVLVAIAGAVIGLFLWVHWDRVSAGEIALAVTAVFLLLPGVVFLLFLRFKDSLTEAADAEAAATAEAQERQQELRKIVDSLIDPILSIDMNGTILTANPAVLQVFGYRAAEVIGHNVRMLMAEPYRGEHDTYIANYMQTAERKAIGRIRKVLGQRRTGEEFACELSVSEIRDSEGLRFVGVVRDISEREELATRLAQAERLAAVGELAAGVAHEINNPINTIINCAQLIKDGDDDPTLTSDIMQEGLRVAGIVRDLLDFARDHREDHSPTRIKDVIDRTMSLVARRIEKTGIQLHVDVPQGLPVIKARSQQLQQVLLNLLLNARDALQGERQSGVRQGQPAEIRVSASEVVTDGRPHIRIVVRDTGPGIDAKDLDRIFQPFFTTKRDRGGTGLGLPVSLGIVKSHQGTVAVRSEKGNFTEFTVELPVDNGWIAGGAGA